jgi:hypothetical protein
MFQFENNMMPDYMESLVCKLGLVKVLTDLREVVVQMAEDSDDDNLLSLIHNLYVSIQELSEDE